jgi:hypothetical protein
MASAIELKVVRRVGSPAPPASSGRRVVLAAGQLVGGGAHVLDGLEHLWRTVRKPRTTSSAVAVMPMIAGTIQCAGGGGRRSLAAPVRRSTRPLSSRWPGHAGRRMSYLRL